jgi:signal peptidase II
MRVAFIVSGIVIAVDQITKWLVVSQFKIGERVDLIQNLLYLTHHRNRGAAWGILQDQMLFFYLVTVIFIGVLVYFILNSSQEPIMFRLSLGLLLGGAIGNFIDRIYLQEVIDFIGVYIGTYPFPIFNIADASLNIGVAIFVMYVLCDEFFKKQKKTI